MASRPFASVAVALELGGDQEELLQVSVSLSHTYTLALYTHTEAKYCDGKVHNRLCEVQVFVCTGNAVICFSYCHCGSQEAQQVHLQIVVFHKTKTLFTPNKTT